MNRGLTAAVAAVGVVVAIVVLRERTMTRHEPGVPGTATEVVISADTRNAVPSASTAELAGALFLTCRVEVEAEPLTDLQRQPGQPSRYRMVLAPELDEFDECQLHVCLEDARINHLQVEVERLRPFDLN